MPVVERGIRLTVEELRRGNALLAAGDDMDKLANETDKVDNKFKLFTQDSKRVQSEIEKSTARVKDLRQQLARTGDTSLFGDIRKEEARARNFRNLLAGLTKDAEEAGVIAGEQFTRGIGSSFQGAASTPGAGPALIAGLVAAAATAAAPIGAAISGAVVGGVGTVGIVGGVLAASHDPRVKAAFQDLADVAKGEFFAAGDSFIVPVLRSVDLLKKGIHDLDLGKTFALAAPDLEVITQGLVDLVHNTLPGLNTLLGRSQIFARAAAEGFGYLGTSISEFLDNVSESPGALEGLRALFAVLGGTIKFLGASLDVLSRSFHAFNVMSLGFFEGTQKFLGVFGVALNPIDQVVGGLKRLTSEGAHAKDVTSAVGGEVDKFALSTQKSADALKRENDELQNTLDLIDKAINGMLGLDNAQLAVSKGWKDLSDAVAENGRHWNDNTDAALRNREAVLQQIGELERRREAEIAANVPLKEANAEYASGLQKVLDYAGALGATKAQLEALKGRYDVVLVLSTFQQSIGSTLANALSGFNFGGHRAAGGDVQAGRSYIVGEHGPEMLTMGGNGHITPNGGAPVNVSITFAPTGSEVADTLLQAILPALRKHVRVNGGDASAAFL